MTDESKAKALAEAEAKAQRVFVFILVGLLAVGALVAAPFLMVRSSGAWQGAVERATADERVKAALGEPVSAEWSFSYSYSKQANETRLEIPLEGGKRNGVLRAIGVETGGVWGFSELRVDADDGTVINVLQRSGAGAP